ncbi:MAG: glycosyltransferase [Eubacteriales bacterium]|nr:glycosyltransferase [Eubacteriales bacterium]
MQPDISPLVSVILPSYNHEKYVGIAIESVLNQSFRDFELLISDDHSSDHTVEVIRRYPDDRIFLHVFSENQGATINHKYLFDQARGKYVALINSDDVWLSSKLEKQVAFLEAHDEIGACFSFAEIIDEEGKKSRDYHDGFQEANRTQAEWYAHFFHFGNCLCHPSILIRTEIYREIGFYNLSLRQLPDFEMWVRLVKHYNIYIFQEPLAQHRRFASSGKNTSAPTMENSMRDAVESSYILNHYFCDVSDRLFAEAFGKEFRKAGASTHNELCCEKFFLLLAGHYYIPQLSLPAAIQYFFEIYSEEGVADTFRDSYNFTLQDFHAISWKGNPLGMHPAGDPSKGFPAAFSGRANRMKSIIAAVSGKESKFYQFCKRLYYRTGK